MIKFVLAITVVLTAFSGNRAQASVFDDSASFTLAKAAKLYRASGNDAIKEISKHKHVNTSCSADKDCQKGYFCVEAKCVACKEDNHCPSGKYCLSNKCIPLCKTNSSMIESCRGSDCSAAETCEQTGPHACQCRSCTYDSDCGAGKRCSGGKCVSCKATEVCNCGAFQKSNGNGGCKCDAESLAASCRPGAYADTDESACVCKNCAAGDATCGNCPTGTVPDGAGECSCTLTAESCGEGETWNEATCSCSVSCEKYGSECDTCNANKCLSCKGGYTLNGAGDCVCDPSQISVANGTCSACTAAGICDKVSCNEDYKLDESKACVLKECSEINLSYSYDCGDKVAAETGKTGAQGVCYTCSDLKCNEIDGTFKIETELSCNDDEKAEKTETTGADGDCFKCVKKSCGDLNQQIEKDCTEDETFTITKGVTGSDGQCGQCETVVGKCSSNSDCEDDQYCKEGSCSDRICLGKCYEAKNHVCEKKSEDCCVTDVDCRDVDPTATCRKLKLAETGLCQISGGSLCMYTDAATCKEKTQNCQYCKKDKDGCYTCSSYYEIESCFKSQSECQSKQSNCSSCSLSKGCWSCEACRTGFSLFGGVCLDKEPSGWSCTGTMTEYTLYGHKFCCPNGVVAGKTANWHSKCMQEANDDKIDNNCDCNGDGNVDRDSRNEDRPGGSRSCSYVRVGNMCVWSGNGIACAAKHCM